MDKITHQFEPEWDGISPREVPAELRNGPFASKRRSSRIACITAGIICLGFSFIPLIQKWGQFVLPLAYLNWIGAGLIIIGVGLFLYHMISDGRFDYVKNGIPLASRILDLAFIPVRTHNGSEASHRYRALVELEHPDTGEMYQFNAMSDEVPQMFKDKYEVTYRIGDTATAVYLPGRFEKTVRLYGFLGLRPDIGMVKKGAESQSTSPFKTIATVCAAAFFIFGMGWCIYALERYMPVEHHWSEFAIGGAGAATIGLSFFIYVIREESRTRRKIALKNEEAIAEGRAVQFTAQKGFMAKRILPIIVLLGALLLGFLVTICFAWAMNAWLDDSPPQYRPVIIIDRIQKTHKGIIRTYEIKYQFLDDASKEKHSYSTSPDEIDSFRIPLGQADIRHGRFGWPWLNVIEPNLQIKAP